LRSGDVILSTGSEYTQTYGGGYDNFILKFAANNSLQWSTFIGGSGQEIFDPSAEWRGSPAIAIDNTNDNVYVCGTSFSSSGSFTLTNSTVFDYNQSTNSQSGSNAYIFAVDNTDQIIWGTFFGGVGTKSINSTYAGANVNVGEFGIDILATNNNVFLTGLSYGSTTSLPFVHPPSNSGAWVHPHSSSLNSDAYISEFNTTSGIGIKSFTSPNKINEYLFYPNPTTGHLNIKGMFPENSIIQVSNVMGQMIYTSRHHHSETEVAIDLSNLSNGIYMVNILNGHSSVSQKIVIFK